METKSSQKKFDAVKTMRQIRDKISAETQDMNFDQLQSYIRKKLFEKSKVDAGKLSK